MPNSDDHAPPFVPFIDISVRLGGLFQRIASIYDRFDLSRLDELFQEEEILRLFAGWPQTCEGKHGLFAPDDRSPCHGKKDWQPKDRIEIHPVLAYSFSALRAIGVPGRCSTSSQQKPQHEGKLPNERRQKDYHGSDRFVVFVVGENQ